MLWLHAIVFLLLALAGAGVVPGVLPVCACALCAATALGMGRVSGLQRLLFWLSLSWLLLIGITLTPLPAGAVGERREDSFRRVERIKAAVEQATHSLAAEAPGEPSPPPRISRRLSLNAPGSGRYLFLSAASLAVFWAVGTSSLRRRRRVMQAVVLLGSALAIAAIVGRYILSQGQWLLWWYPVDETNSTNTLGPFVNRNHFAAFTAMLVPLAFGLCLPSRHGSGREDEPRQRPLALRPRWILPLLLLTVAVFLSHSRGGIGALLIGVTVTALCWLRADRRIATVAAAVGIGLFLALALWPDQALQQRFQQMRQEESLDPARVEIWRRSIALWRQYPLWGCGTSAYHAVFHPGDPLPLGKTATHAESTYLHLLAEGGIVAFLFAITAIVLSGVVAYRSIRPSWPRRRGERPSSHSEDDRLPPTAASSRHSSSRLQDGPAVLPANLASGALGALAALAVHAVVDIPLRVPLGAVLAAATAGMLMPPRQRHTAFPSPLREAPSERLALAGLALVGCLALWHRPGWQALYSDSVRAESADHPAELIAALELSPQYWYLWELLNQRLQQYADNADTPERRDALAKASLLALEEAVHRRPDAPALLAQLAARHWEAGDLEEARETYYRLFAVQPTDPKDRVTWMRTEWQNGHRDAARHIAAHSAPQLHRPEQQAALWRELAALETTLGSVQRRLDALRQAAACAPTHVHTLKLIAACERDLGYRDQEQQTLTRITELAPKDWQSWWRLAEIHAADKRGGAVNHALSQAVTLNPRLRPKAAELWRKMLED